MDEKGTKKSVYLLSSWILRAIRKEKKARPISQQLEFNCRPSLIQALAHKQKMKKKSI
ncbi:hypothetical protein PPO43_10455 [Saprospira sp. CCB-QB6]|uniref:hypothetical protein n=1 Tax=Saprospira sp. CCB-QB6 TaxID=3023936 RepID=UPI002349259B|nr:hypothetical protein [Saprospira sp. CCB-QB6]WCL80392.1 hypothetical protein PPO43_10455 [Saprospira sp. CCB-QB6]